jgi:hypothetical protein
LRSVRRVVRENAGAMPIAKRDAVSCVIHAGRHRERTVGLVH